MHKNWVGKMYDQSMDLPMLMMKMTRTPLRIVLYVSLRSIYRKQAIVTTHKQSCKRIEEKIPENFENKQLTLATENNF